MSERIVLDTNVLVWALLVQGSIPHQVLDTVLTVARALVVDGRVMREYREFLSSGVIRLLIRPQWNGALCGDVMT